MDTDRLQTLGLQPWYSRFPLPGALPGSAMPAAAPRVDPALTAPIATGSGTATQPLEAPSPPAPEPTPAPTSQRRHQLHVIICEFTGARVVAEMPSARDVLTGLHLCLLEDICRALNLDWVLTEKPRNISMPYRGKTPSAQQSEDFFANDTIFKHTDKPRPLLVFSELLKPLGSVYPQARSAPGLHTLLQSWEAKRALWQDWNRLC